MAAGWSGNTFLAALTSALLKVEGLKQAKKDWSDSQNCCCTMYLLLKAPNELSGNGLLKFFPYMYKT
jgi:hypothetical protein